MKSYCIIPGVSCLHLKGVKQVTDSVIKSSIQKRSTAFEAAVTTLMERFQAEFLKV